MPTIHVEQRDQCEEPPLDNQQPQHPPLEPDIRTYRQEEAYPREQPPSTIEIRIAYFEKEDRARHNNYD